MNDKDKKAKWWAREKRLRQRVAKLEKRWARKNGGHLIDKLMLVEDIYMYHLHKGIDLGYYTVDYTGF
jgi:hypothetical protein